MTSDLKAEDRLRGPGGRPVALPKGNDTMRQLRVTRRARPYGVDGNCMKC